MAPSFTGKSLILLRFVLLFVALMMLAGCPGPNYAPYDNMTNSPG